MKLKSKGQASNAAAFVAILMVLIIMYILFLPPDIRTELLGDKNAALLGNKGSEQSSVLLKQTVGIVSYINSNEKIYDLPATRISSPTSAQIIKSIPSINILRALLDTERASYTFEFELDPEATKNVLLSFNVNRYSGPLIIELNGKEIFNAQITNTNPNPIPLDVSELKDSNTIVMKTTSPGFAFWRVHRYEIEALQITGDVTDYSNSDATQYFTLSRAQKDNLENVRLYFYPNCKITDVGSLRIDLNQRTIYNSLADCGTRTFAVLNEDDLVTGSNELRFHSNKGSYTLDNMYVKVTLSKPMYQTYFFDLKKDYFIDKGTKERCGDYDGTCPAGCEETVDPDCCFDRNGNWCSLPTLNANDRCMFYVSVNNCGICKTGYYDSYGDSPENCENTPGDNNDDRCLSGTTEPSRYYDKDCCFAENPDNYWCSEVPITGISDKCKANIDPSECDLCPSGYENEDGSSPDSCNVKNLNVEDEDLVLSNDYEVKLTVRFANDRERKRLDININGKTFRIDTTSVEYTKNINSYVREDTNSIELVPVEDDLNIAELKVEFRKVR